MLNVTIMEIQITNEISYLHVRTALEALEEFYWDYLCITRITSY